ncbi:MAG: ATP-dependent DNA helicase [Candidatus Heimdallarchaeota archaeon]|nr:ATP-dependent DNA helicase [Candidatus Heimdallarchaeota archaeon]
MASKPIIKVSVRNLISYVLRKGDISVGYFQRSRLAEGTKGHQYVQRKRGPNYKKEVAVNDIIERENCSLQLGGRIDGIFVAEGKIFLEEIKTTQKPLATIKENSSASYWAQAICYAYIYSKQNSLNSINVQLTYFHLDTKKTRSFVKVFRFEEVEKQCIDLVDKYLDWALTIYNWLEERNKSINKVKFPFPSYRTGQDKLIKVASDVLKNQKKLFCQAPTGIGKTIATLFPAIKSLNGGLDSKIFYLTAKTTTRFIAEETLDILRKNSLRMKSVTITAKAKICFKEKDNCDPVYCEYARGHFDRVNKAVEDIFTEDSFTREVIEKYAKKHMVCPFEFSLDLANWSDCIICDYNYVFDPRVYLRRFFLEDKGDFTFLIDEAHNLVDRSREMFSAELIKNPILDLRRVTKDSIPKLSTLLNKLNQHMIAARKLCERDGTYSHIQTSLPSKEFISDLRKFCFFAEEWLELNLATNFRDKLLEFYFNARNFLRVVEDYDNHFVTYFKKFKNNVRIRLYCLDPSKLLKEALKRGKSAMFFSATLTPNSYFQELLGGDSNSAKLLLNSPFPRENLGLFIADYLSTKFKMRELSYEEIAYLIEVTTKSKVGNFLVFFPSYAYMEEVYTHFLKLNSKAKIVKQSQGMSEKEREEFLDEFSKFGKKTLIGFVVMGGIFAEGIDLIGEKLSGAVIVGVGLPKVCLEQDLLRSYFDKKNGKGFLFAYTYPGMNRVLQAVGRVIRTETDRGVVLLIGDRYATSTYTKLFPQHWETVPRIAGKEDLARKIKRFW